MATRLLTIGLTAAGAVALSTLPASAGTLKIVNNSIYDIEALYLSPAKSKNWGQEQLENSPIEMGASFTLSGIPAGRYRVKLVDEDDVACEIPDVNLSSTKVITVTDEMLLNCAKRGR